MAKPVSHLTTLPLKACNIHWSKIISSLSNEEYVLATNTNLYLLPGICLEFYTVSTVFQLFNGDNS